MHLLIFVSPCGEDVVSGFLQRSLPTSEDRDVSTCVIAELEQENYHME